MSRPRNSDPSYRLHAKTGRACMSVYKHNGQRTEIILPGLHGSKESREEYDRQKAELKSNHGRLPAPKEAIVDLTIAELVERFLREHVEMHYRHPDGTATSERAAYIFALKPLVRLFAPKLAREFSPLDLRAYQTALIHGSWVNDEDRAKLTKRGRDGTRAFNSFGMSRSRE